MENFRGKIFFALALSLAGARPASAAGVSGGGGDAYSNEFVSIAYTVLLPKLAQAPVAGVEMGALASAIAGTKVNSQDSLTLSGNDVSAINYPDPVNPHIEVSRQDWDLLKTEPYRKTFLVFHEYLGILKIDDTHYQVSERLDSAKVCSRSPAVRDAMEKGLGITCDRMIPSDLARISTLFVSNADSFAPGDFFDLPNLGSLKLQGSFSRVPKGIFNSADVSLHSDSVKDILGFPTFAEVQIDSTRMNSLNADAFSDVPGYGGALELGAHFDHVTSKNFAAMGFETVELWHFGDNTTPMVIESGAFAGDQAPNSVVGIFAPHLILSVAGDSFAGIKAAALYLGIGGDASNLNARAMGQLPSVTGLTLEDCDWKQWPADFLSSFPNLKGFQNECLNSK